jgi:hypothetical protein
MTRHRHMNPHDSEGRRRPYFFPYLSVSFTTNPEPVVGLRVLSYLLT